MADLPKPGEEVSRDRVLQDHELAVIWKAAAALGWPFGDVVRLLILTGARRNEIAALSWSELVGDEIRLSSERTKNGEPRTIPLSGVATEIIRVAPRVGDHYVFTTKDGTHINGWSKYKRRIDLKAAEIDGGPLAPWHLHDLRRTVATGLQRLGVRLEVVETVLGHVGGSRSGVVGIYQRYRFEAETREALEKWGAEVTRVVRDVAEPPKVVVRLPKRAHHGR
jgi:integrase